MSKTKTSELQKLDKFYTKQNINWNISRKTGEKGKRMRMRRRRRRRMRRRKRRRRRRRRRRKKKKKRRRNTVKSKMK
jgi:hypothetical protein